jgi:hypothetical protein
MIRKRTLLIAAMVCLVVGLMPACELLEECGTCELVTVNADGTKTYGTPLPYCGDALKEKQNAPPVTAGGVTTYWECD